MDALDTIRKEIDGIDSQLVALFEQRMKKVLEVVEYKKANGLPILQEDREKRVVEKVINQLHYKEFAKEVEHLFHEIFSISRNLQTKRYHTLDLAPEPITIAFQGERGAFGEQALRAYFGDYHDVVNYKQFEDIFIAMQENQIKYGVLPIENSYAGGVYEVYDLLNHYNFYIKGEIDLPIEHHLLGLPNAAIEDIEEVYSHVQAIQQCKDFLKAFPHWNVIPYSNTAASAKLVHEQGDLNKAAIASLEAADIYGLKVLQRNIHTNKENTTRFIIISRKLEVKENAEKISLIYSLPHKTGSLYESLGIFALNSLNLVKIESRPTKKDPWQYNFYVDLAGNLNDPKVKRTLDIVQEKSIYFKILGNY